MVATVPIVFRVSVAASRPMAANTASTSSARPTWDPASASAWDSG